MPIRLTRPRKEEGLKKFIPMLYEKPSLKFLKFGEPWAPICDLIYGPDEIYLDKFFDEAVRERSRLRLEELQKLWGELGADIVAAHEHYQPKKKPWGDSITGDKNTKERFSHGK